MRFLVYLLVMIIFTGCISKQDFPSSWEKIEKKDNYCSNITGTYVNKGVLIQSRYSPLLSNILLDSSKDISLIKLLLNDKKLIITGYSNNKLIKSKELDINENNLSCKDNFWTFEIDEIINKGGVLAKQWDTYFLSKTNEGLVIKKKSTASGLMFLIPIIGSDSTWILFQKKELYRKNK